MKCPHFESCGGCQSAEPYAIALTTKRKSFENIFGFTPDKVFDSAPRGFRARGEFRLHRERDKEGNTTALSLCMNSIGANSRTPIKNCPNLLPHLQALLAKLPTLLLPTPLEHKLYAINLLGSNTQETILTLIYHKKLDEAWHTAAESLAKSLNISIIGRAKNQKITIGKSLITSTITLKEQTLTYLHQEGSFSQPNPAINAKMLSFITESIAGHERRDLLEMYCGSGNFTIALARYFHKVLATEVVKSAIPILEQNAQNNQIHNIHPARLSGAETIEALKFSRDFFRLKGLDLREFDFSHILIDPPRSGIADAQILDFIAKFDTIIYISCNPLTLQSDYAHLSRTHTITQSAIFDQFPHTHHLESALILQKRYCG